MDNCFKLFVIDRFRVISPFQNMEDTLEQLLSVVNNTISAFRLPIVDDFMST